MFLSLEKIVPAPNKDLDYFAPGYWESHDHGDVNVNEIRKMKEAEAKSGGKAKKFWDRNYTELGGVEGELEEMHLIVGGVLGVWKKVKQEQTKNRLDLLRGQAGVKVIRISTTDLDENRTYLGLHVPNIVIPGLLASIAEENEKAADDKADADAEKKAMEDIAPPSLGLPSLAVAGRSAQASHFKFHPERIYLTVPQKDKHLARALGIGFDEFEGKFYVGHSEKETKELQKWINPRWMEEIKVEGLPMAEPGAYYRAKQSRNKTPPKPRAKPLKWKRKRPSPSHQDDLDFIDNDDELQEGASSDDDFEPLRVVKKRRKGAQGKPVRKAKAKAKGRMAVMLDDSDEEFFDLTSNKSNIRDSTTETGSTTETESENEQFSLTG